jgi:hypothetical protein
VYKITCKNTSKVYIGNTQQYSKKECSNTSMIHQFGTKSDSYAKHFAAQFSNLDILTPNLQRNSITCEILWQGNPINVVKTFGTPKCALCNKERLEILKNSRKTPESLINSCNQIYGACRHKPKFHTSRYESRTPSTDDSMIDKRVALAKSNTNMMCGKCLTDCCRGRRQLVYNCSHCWMGGAIALFGPYTQCAWALWLLGSDCGFGRFLLVVGDSCSHLLVLLMWLGVGHL